MRTQRPRVLFTASLFLLVSSLAGAQQAQVPVEEHFLDNGMKLLLVERHDSPTISAGWVAHVGSANESYGSTGMAHLFEHMMFKGTTTIGTTDWTAERELMKQLDQLRSQMNVEYTKLRVAKRKGEISGSIFEPGNATPRLEELREQMHELQAQEKQLIVKDEIDQIYTSNGASSMNAGTTNDFTVYFVTIPANKLELWFWMESDRLLNPVFREFYSERDVVREERRMRVESDPTAKYEEQFSSMFWMSTPYHHPTVGWPSDVEAINREEADRFFATFYAPNNLTAVLVGDFETEQALQLAATYFGRIARGSKSPPEVITEEIEQVSPRRMTAEADTNPTVELSWHTVAFVHTDRYALDLLAAILNGRSGRLYQSLVEQRQLATGEPYASASPLKYGGNFDIGAELADGVTHEAMEAAILSEVERLQREPVSVRELQKVKNQSLAYSFRRLQSNFFLSLQLLIYDAWGDWQYLNTSTQRLQEVTAEDIMRVAKTYLTPDGINALWFSRKEGSTEDPRLAALPAQQRPMIKQMLAHIASSENVEQLRQMLSNMKAGADQVPPDQQKGFELIMSTLSERLTELTSQAEEE